MSVFESQTEATEEQGSVEDKPALNVPEELTDLIGEGKKYKSLEDALKSIPHAQGHISNLEKELAELRDDLGKRLSAEEALNKILEERQRSEVEGTPPPDFSPDTLKNLVKDTYKEMSEEERRSHNVTTADQAVREKWGDKAAEMLRNKAEELGVGVQFLQDTAAHSPKAFFNLIGLDGVQKQQEMPRQGSVNTDGMEQSGGTTPYSYKWYQQMRRNDPKQYYTPKVQMEMHRKAAEMGDKFYN